MITFSTLGRHGQLGNQLFQYALLIGVAAKRGFRIRIPKNYVGKKKFGLVELSKFQITADELVRGDRQKIKHRYREDGFDFNPAVFEQPDGTDYNGYFQTSKYFEHAADEVRREFTFIESIDRYAKTYIDQERNQPCIVAVHVRRGDYLKEPNLFQILSKEYYEQVMNHPSLPDHKQFLVFSDDMNWCRQNLLDERITYVQSSSHWYDLAIMTYCDAHIISASTFSWWGAYLSHNRNNTVIAPTPWFPAGPRDDWNTKDVLPEHWHKVDAIHE